MGSLTELRKELNRIDGELLQLFVQRMAVVEQVAQVKVESGGAIFVPEREREILQGIDEKLPPALKAYGHTLFKTVLRLSRARQYELNLPTQPWLDPPTDQGNGQSAPGEQLFPETAETLEYALRNELYIQKALSKSSGERFFVLGQQLTLPAPGQEARVLLMSSGASEDLQLLVNTLNDLGFTITKLEFSEASFVAEFAASLGQSQEVGRALFQLEQELKDLRLLGWYTREQIAS